MDWGNTIVFVVCTAIVSTYITIATNISVNQFANTTKDEQVGTSSLFLIGLTKDSKRILIPLLISTDDSVNVAQAGTWTANGRKLGLGGRYLDGKYILEAEPSARPYIRTISFVSDPIGPPIPYPSAGTKKMLTYLQDTPLGAQTPLWGPDGCLLTGNPIEDPPMTYRELQDLALGTLGGVCGPANSSFIA